MTEADTLSPRAGDIDVASLGRALWQAKGWILGLAAGAGVLTFIVLSMMRPLYTSEARILIQNDEQAFTRPAEDQGRELPPPVLDEQAVQSQVQVLTSRDLAMQVIKGLDLINNPDFQKDAGRGFFKRLLYSIGIGRGTLQSEEEKAANAFAEHLDVFQLAKSSVIAIEYTSGSSPLAAEIANKLADVYISWQRDAKIEQTKDATAWLSTQIDVLRKRTAESEAAVEQFRSSQGLFAGTNNVTLNAQQLSELNSQLILAKAQQSEAEARAKLIKSMLAENGDIDATPEVLRSPLIARLIEQRVQVQRQLAELSATLLPSHPRLKQLQSELADVRAQIRKEADKIVKGLENEAQVARAREASLRSSLNDLKTQASGLSEAEIKLRALEREAKANRDLLESYLARYRDASARHDMGAVPAQAAIVSRAHSSILPSFPKKGPITLLVTLATALLALAYVVARELVAAPMPAPMLRRAPREEEEDEDYQLPVRPRRRASRTAQPAPFAPPSAPPPMRPAAAARSHAQAQAQPQVQDRPAPHRAAPEAPPAPPRQSQAAETKQAPTAASPVAASASASMAAQPPRADQAAALAAARPETAAATTRTSSAAESQAALEAMFPKLPPLISAPKPGSQTSAGDKPAEPETAMPASRPDVRAAEKTPRTEQEAQAPEKAPAAQAAQPKPDELPRPAWPRKEAAAETAKQTATSAPAAEPAAPAAAPAAPKHDDASSNMIERLRRGLAENASETAAKQPLTAKGVIDRLRKALPIGKDRDGASDMDRDGSSVATRDIPPLRANDLRHYLSKRIGAKLPDADKDDIAGGIPPAPKVGNGKVGPTLKSIDAVLNHVLASGKGVAPRALLVSGVSAKVDATAEAIQIARALVARHEQVVLVDLTRGPAAVSGRLGLPRAPGFTDLAASRARFDQVLKIDETTPLQVIAAGNPTLKGSGDDPDRFMRVFDALTQAYDTVVLHGDPEIVRILKPALKFELPAAVVVLPADASSRNATAGLADFAALGCPVVVYEQDGKGPRAGLLGRAAAI